MGCGQSPHPNEFSAFVPAMRDVMRAGAPAGRMAKQEILDLEDNEAAA